MKVSNVKINWKNPENRNPKAFGSAVIEDCVSVDFTVMSGSKGLFVSLPQQKGKDDKWSEKVRFLNKEDRATFQKEVLEVFEGAETPKTTTSTNDEEIPF